MKTLRFIFRDTAYTIGFVFLIAAGFFGLPIASFKGGHPFAFVVGGFLLYLALGLLLGLAEAHRRFLIGSLKFRLGYQMENEAPFEGRCLTIQDAEAWIQNEADAMRWGDYSFTMAGTESTIDSHGYRWRGVIVKDADGNEVTRFEP